MPTPTPTAPLPLTRMVEDLAQIKLMTWLSPAFPVGAFAFSQGLEWAVESGALADAADLGGWIEDALRQGAPRADSVLLAAAWRAPGDAIPLNELAHALAPSRERHLETAAQGSAFLSAVSAAWPAPDLAGLDALFAEKDIAYPVAVGLAARAHALALGPTLEAFLLALVANLVSAALRLGLVGQSQAQTVLAQASPMVAALARWACDSTLDDIGTCAWRADIASMRHETQYSRLFRS